MANPNSNFETTDAGSEAAHDSVPDLDTAESDPKMPERPSVNLPRSIPSPLPDLRPPGPQPQSPRQLLHLPDPQTTGSDPDFDETKSEPDLSEPPSVNLPTSNPPDSESTGSDMDPLTAALLEAFSLDKSSRRFDPVRLMAHECHLMAWMKNIAIAFARSGMVYSDMFPQTPEDDLTLEETYVWEQDRFDCLCLIYNSIELKLLNRICTSDGLYNASPKDAIDTIKAALWGASGQTKSLLQKEFYEKTVKDFPTFGAYLRYMDYLKHRLAYLQAGFYQNFEVGKLVENAQLGPRYSEFEKEVLQAKLTWETVMDDLVSIEFDKIEHELVHGDASGNAGGSASGSASGNVSGDARGSS
ncbi:hypothetical protein B0T25DRAFT_562575 [Lasiosphaeria hispida]|uniref:Uncharacterized protein n=1 Tax=Lasiosphaeria hispida TaxID=260671 RepID=A0AAJ0HVX9_9PEZI|nr:hypothetical protein B0T25DRAFT_562575 [Lasiosphaeria hispida]